MRSPEGAMGDTINPDHVYARAQEMLEIDAIHIEDFADLYGKDQIDQDKAYVEKRERQFQENQSPEDARAAKIATILEAIIHEQVEQSDWFGPEAHTIKPTRYDDIAAGVDSLVEFQTPDERRASYLGLAIDVTFSTRKMDEKLERIRDRDIGQGELARIKYFASEYMGIRGEIKDIPRVVIGADIRTVQELIDAWVDPDRKQKNAFFAKHPLQRVLLEEIVMQLDTFEQYARSVGKTEVADIYGKTNTAVRRILREKDSLKTSASLQGDRIYSGIQERLGTVFRKR